MKFAFLTKTLEDIVAHGKRKYNEVDKPFEKTVRTYLAFPKQQQQ